MFVINVAVLGFVWFVTTGAGGAKLVGYFQKPCICCEKLLSTDFGSDATLDVSIDSCIGCEKLFSTDS